MAIQITSIVDDADFFILVFAGLTLSSVDFHVVAEFA